jgi:hypothetical protein
MCDCGRQCTGAGSTPFEAQLAASLSRSVCRSRGHVASDLQQPPPTLLRRLAHLVTRRDLRDRRIEVAA